MAVPTTCIIKAPILGHYLPSDKRIEYFLHAQYSAQRFNCEYSRHWKKANRGKKNYFRQLILSYSFIAVSEIGKVSITSSLYKQFPIEIAHASEGRYKILPMRDWTYFCNGHLKKEIGKKK